MPLSFNPSKPVPFYQLEPDPLQELCRDLFEREEGISSCEIYGTKGQLQRGIDLIAWRKGSDVCEVGQCKCYEDFQPHEIRQASNEFLKHLAYWKRKNVKRFILFVACPMDPTQRQDEIAKQIKRFRKLGIQYEVWSARTLRTKLKDARDIVFRHSRSKEWVESICGPDIGGNVGVDRAVALVETIVGGRLPVYAAEHSREISRRLDGIRELYRKGSKKAALQELEEIRGGASWEIIEASLKGRLLRQQAAYMLDLNGDAGAARRLADEASKLDPQGDQSTIRAILSYYAEGPDAALQIVAPDAGVPSFNLRLALLIESGRASEALDSLRSVPQTVQPDNETRRLKALALLLSGDLENARAEIEQARESEPEWEGVRYTSAVINYFSSLPPASVPKTVAWPEPPGWVVLKRDDISLGRLKYAESTFAALARNAEQDERRADFETWRLACVANDPYRQEEARSLCIEQLDRDPRRYRALIWAIARNYEIDYSPCEQALRDFVEDDSGERVDHQAEALGVLLTLYLKQNEVAQADAALTRRESLFLKIEERQRLAFWRNQILIAGGRSQEAEDIARKERDPESRRVLLLSALRAQAERTGKWGEFLRYLKKSFKRTSRPELLFEMYSIKADQEKWDFIAERADALVETCQTAAALRIAAIALSKVKSPGRCLILLNNGARFFHNNLLPGDLGRLKVQCQIAKGELPQAGAEARRLLTREQTPANILTLMEAHRRRGDLKELAITARRLLQSGPAELEIIGPQNLIRAADLVYFEDKGLAKDLWQAAARAVDNQQEALAELVATGYALGLDRELKPYFARMVSDSQKGAGALKTISLKELMALRQEQAQKARDAQQTYDSGLEPLHMFAPQLNLTMAEVLHGLPELHRRDFKPLNQPRIYVRHGGRPLLDELIESLEKPRLHLDISALILAEDLEILDEVEAAFKPLFISTGTTEALLAQRRNLRFHQPSQLNGRETALKLLGENKLRRLRPGTEKDIANLDALGGVVERKGAAWAAALAQADSERGFLVDHLPLIGNDLSGKEVIIPDPYQARVIGCRAVVDSLKARGWMGAEEYQRAQIALGAEKYSILVASDMAPDLTPGSTLYLMGATASLLADAGALESACRYYRIHVDEWYINEARIAIDAMERATRLDEWIGRLLGRISEGLESGVYRCVQIPDGQPAAEWGEEMGVIYDLMLAANQPGDVLWIDDRWLNSLLRNDATPIIGISEALSALRRRGLISEQDYYSKLLKLRAGNIRYIPIDAEEILYHLNHAGIADGALISTPELRTLKKYLAGCLLDAGALQIPPLPAEPPHPVGEMAFVFDAKSAVEAAIARVWRNDQASPEDLAARADWLLGNLYTGGGGLRHLLPHIPDDADPARLLGLDIGGMFTIGCLSIIDLVLENETASRLGRFADWFEERFLIPRFTANPEVAQIAGVVISAFINDAARRRHESPNHEQVARLGNSLLYEHMPDILKAYVSLDQNVMAWIGMRADCVAIEGTGFDKAEFAHAVEDIMGGAPNARIRALDSEAEYRLKRMPDEDGIPVVGVFAQGAELDPIWRIKDAILAMASPDSAAREVSLRAHKRWLDCDRERFEQAVREINDIEDLMTRMRKVQDWRDESAEVHYRHFAYKLGRTHAFQWAELIPFSAEGLLRHYRLPADAGSDGDFREALERSALTLLDEEGVETALERLARLPVIIPDALAQELGSLADEERSAILEGCASRWASPVGKLNLAHIILRFPSQNAALTRVALSAIEGLFDEEGKSGFDLFKALLDFTYDRFSLWNEVQAWAPSLKLAMVWAHAVRLYDVFRSVSGPAATAELAKAFESYNRDRGSINIMRRQTSLWNDALHPRRFSKAVFLTHGVASVLDDASVAEPDKL